MARPPRGLLLTWRSTLGRDPGALAGLVLLTVIVLAAVFAPLVAPADPTAQVLREHGQPPAWLPGGVAAHPFGTDHLGRDVASRVIFAGRTSLIVGVTTTLLSLLLGVSSGLFAGYAGGLWDDAINRIIEIQLSIPYILLAIALLVVVGQSFTNLVLVLALNSWVVYARVVRVMVLSMRTSQFVEAAKVVGASDQRIIINHLLPNLLGSVIVLATLEIPSVIILEGTMSFLGVGIQSPQVSWGLLLSEGRNYLTNYWWITAFPGLALSATVVSLNTVGDWLRDILDPRLRTA
jgi:peptide/nickel transport system permease protein